MFNDPYFHFKEIYKHSDELVVCIDVDLNPVYMTTAFRNKFGFDPRSEILLNCFIPTSYFGKISSAISQGTSISIDYISIRDDQPKRCIVVPYTVSNKKYASLLIIEASSLSFDSRQNAKMKNYIAKVEKAIEALTSQIILDLRVKYKDDVEFDLYSNDIFRNTMKIRKLFQELFMMSNYELKAQRSYPINVNFYLERSARIIKKVLKNKIDVSLDLCKMILVTEISYDILDIFTSIIVELCVRHSKNSFQLYIKSLQKGNENIVVFSDNSDDYTKLLSNLADPNSFEDENLAVASTILKKQNGRISLLPNKTGGYSFAFSLPVLSSRNMILREDENLAESKDLFSTLAIGLMALTGADTNLIKIF